MKDDLICLTKISTIKKAFFGGKLNQLINEMQGSGALTTADDVKELKEFLETLKVQNIVVLDEMKDGFSVEMGEDSIVPPSVDELSGEDSSTEKWIQDKETALNMIRAKMKVVRDKLGKDANFDIKELQDLAFELSFWTIWISMDRIYKRQLWKRKLTELMDTYKISRKEAEDRSELTKEYRDYVLADEFKDSVDNIIVSARRGYSE